MARSLADITVKSKFRKFLWPRRRVLLPFVAACIAGASSAVGAQEWIPYRCCPKTDCQPAAEITVTEVRGGFSVEGVKGVVAYDDPRVQPSLDGKYHACIRSQARPFMDQSNAAISGQDRELKCLFVPVIG